MVLILFDARTYFSEESRVAPGYSAVLVTERYFGLELGEIHSSPPRLYLGPNEIGTKRQEISYRIVVKA